LTVIVIDLLLFCAVHEICIYLMPFSDRLEPWRGTLRRFPVKHLFVIS